MVSSLYELSDIIKIADKALAKPSQMIEPVGKRLDLFRALRERLVRVHDTNSASAAARLGISGSDQKAGFPPASSIKTKASPRVRSAGFSI